MTYFDTSRACLKINRKEEHSRATTPSLPYPTQLNMQLRRMSLRRTMAEQSRPLPPCHQSRQMRSRTTSATISQRVLLLHVNRQLQGTGHHQAEELIRTRHTRHSNTTSAGPSRLHLRAVSHSDHYVRLIWTVCLAASACYLPAIAAAACEWTVSRTSPHALGAQENILAATGETFLARNWVL